MFILVADQVDAGGHECASGYHILFSHKMTIGFQYAVMDFNRYCDILGHVRFPSTTAIRKDSICAAPNIVMLVADHLAYRHLCHHTIT